MKGALEVEMTSMMMRTAMACLFVLAPACGGEVTPGDGGTHDASGSADGAVVVCERDGDCADALFCNGAERCMPGASGADARGCVSGAPACDADCDEERDRCSGCSTDGDSDGEVARSCGGTDCDDSDPDVRSGAEEVCDADGLDEDCDSDTIQSSLDDGDTDHDGHVATRCFNLRADGTENRGDDCDDAVGGVHPGAADGCGGGDEDCDGDVDEEGGLTFYRDDDGDGFGDDADSVTACDAPTGYVATRGDCDDLERDTNPSRAEYCGGADEDCDGTTDEGAASDALSYYLDADGDGEATPSSTATRSCAPLSGHVTGPRTDCNDRDARAYRGSPLTAFYSTPHCEIGFACRFASGAWDCVAAMPPGEPCPAGATSVGTPSWDFDCNGSVRVPQDLGSSPCSWTGTACTSITGLPFTTTSHSASECGFDAELWSCVGDSSTCAAGVRITAPLPCQ